MRGTVISRERYRSGDPSVMELAAQPGGVTVVGEDGRVICHLSIPCEALVCDDADCVEMREQLASARAEALHLAEELAAALTAFGPACDAVAVGRVRHVERVLSGRPFEVKP